MAVVGVPQSVAGVGREPAHTHGDQIHVHDHYHVALVHEAAAQGGWKHETTWHTHQHNHSATTHSHDFPRNEEEQRHGKRAHIHDHAAPTRSPA